jgi:Ca2+-binding EF-hand superfamily protein
MSKHSISITNLAEKQGEEYTYFLEVEEKNKIKEIFELFDKNLDGGIDIKELKFILNSLDIYPNHDELSSMMFEADRTNKGYISEEDFLYIIAKQKVEYKSKLTEEASKISLIIFRKCFCCHGRKV